MTKTILDACIVASYLLGNEKHSETAKDLILNLESQQHTVLISTMQQIELTQLGQRGEHGSKSANRKGWLASLDHFYDIFGVVSIALTDEQISTARQHWTSSPLKLGDSLFLAAAAYAKADVAYTFDKQICKIAKQLRPGFPVIDPTEKQWQGRFF